MTNMQMEYVWATAFREAWIAYRYGDRDPEVKRMAKAYEEWLAGDSQ